MRLVPMVGERFHLTADEAAARCDIGEQHTGILLATTAIGAMETIQGSEYGLETRAICCEAMQRASSPQAPEMHRRAAAHARRLHAGIHDAHFAALFLRRPVVGYLLGVTPADAPAGVVEPEVPGSGPAGVAPAD